MLFGGETAESYYEEGLTAAMKGDLPLAVARLGRALELNTQLHNARYQLGKCCLRMGRPEEALKHLQVAEKYLLQAPPRIDTGYALLLLGRVDEARHKFSDALQVKSDDPRAIMGLARCAAAKEQWGTVVNLAQHTLELGHATFDAYYLLARSADKCDMPGEAAQNYTKAVEIIDKSIEASPDNATGYFLRGNAFFYQENYTAALSDYDAALGKAAPDAHYAAYHEHFTYGDILCMRGLCQQQLRQYDLAMETGKRILAIDPDNETGKRLAANMPGEDRKGHA